MTGRDRGRICEGLARGWSEYRDSVIVRRDGQTVRWVSGGIEAMGTCPDHGPYRTVYSLAPYPIDGQPIGCPACVALLPPARRYDEST